MKRTPGKTLTCGNCHHLVEIDGKAVCLDADLKPDQPKLYRREVKLTDTCDDIRRFWLKG